MILLFSEVLKDGIMTPLVLQQNSKEIKEIYVTQVYKTEPSQYGDRMLYNYSCELYKEVIVIETITEKLEIEFVNNYAVNTAWQYLSEKMANISDYDSDGTFYTKLKDNI